MNAISRRLRRAPVICTHRDSCGKVISGVQPIAALPIAREQRYKKKS